ncbi:MAG: hypothetical protein M1819_004704 [Sarea resinae]|nr:MAG: hypothetical protein M1819_004704 [Sarea resinae]
MAPIRRYMRISKYSVLECRIYLDNPAIANSWLLNPRDPVLPRVFDSVRPLILPKLKEENEKSKAKKKNKGVKDIVVEDDFEVSIFLTDISTRHSLLTKQKIFRDKPQRLESNSSKLTGTQEGPVEIEDDAAPVVIREESDESEANIRLADIPAVTENETEEQEGPSSRQRKRPRHNSDSLFLHDSEESEDDAIQLQRDSPPAKRSKGGPRDGSYTGIVGSTDDKKKLALSTLYDGFAIYGRVLCLVVKRRGGQSKTTAAGGSGITGGQAMMEQWISTQAQQEADDG